MSSPEVQTLCLIWRLKYVGNELNVKRRKDISSCTL